MNAKRADTRTRWGSQEVALKIRTADAGGYLASSRQFYMRHRVAVTACCLLLVMLMSASACALKNQAGGSVCQAESMTQPQAPGTPQAAAPDAKPLAPISYDTTQTDPQAPSDGHEPVAGGGIGWHRSQLLGLYVLEAQRYVPDWTRSQLLGLYVLEAPRYVPDWTRSQLLGLYVLEAPRYVPNWTRDQLIGIYTLTAARYVPNWTRDQLIGKYVLEAKRYVPTWRRDQLIGVYTLEAPKYFGDP